MTHKRFAGTHIGYTFVKGKKYYLVPAKFMREFMSHTPYKLE
jgi:hypothetical protein